MMKNNLKNKKTKQQKNTGITLIALVVTIIVLLILAGISIMMLSGNNGILNRAIEAKVETRGGEVQQERDMWKLTQTTDKYATTKVPENLDELLERIGPNNQKLLTAEEVEEVKATGQVTIGSRTIVFGFENQLEIGDVVTVTGLKKFKDSENQDIDWIYFGTDDKGNNLITTAKPLPNSDGYTFTWNKQPANATANEKIENSAKNWLYYDLQEGQAGYDDKDTNGNDICTAENNINKFCANLYSNLYSDSEDVVGKARSITLDDINNVTGFKAPSFNKYEFGVTDNNYNATNSNGNYVVNYYYPSLDAENQTTDTTNANSKVYKYWKKAKKLDNGNIEDAKDNIPCDAYSYYKEGDNYKLSWKGTTRNWAEEELSATSTWKLEKTENMKYVTGENSELAYAVGSRSIFVASIGAFFRGAYVSSGDVSSNSLDFCSSDADRAYGFSGFSVHVRPVVSLESGIKLNKE